MMTASVRSTPPGRKRQLTEVDGPESDGFVIDPARAALAGLVRVL